MFRHIFNISQDLVLCKHDSATTNEYYLLKQPNFNFLAINICFYRYMFR